MQRPIFKQSGSLKFPFEEDYELNSLQRATTVEEVLNSAIKAFLITESGDRLGNSMGCFISSIIHQLVGEQKRVEIENGLLQELSEQFPEVTFIKVSFIRNSEQVDVVEYLIQLVYTTPYTSVQELEVAIRQ